MPRRVPRGAEELREGAQAGAPLRGRRVVVEQRQEQREKRRHVRPHRGARDDGELAHRRERARRVAHVGLEDAEHRRGVRRDELRARAHEAREEARGALLPLGARRVLDLGQQVEELRPHRRHDERRVALREAAKDADRRLARAERLVVQRHQEQLALAHLREVDVKLRRQRAQHRVPHLGVLVGHARDQQPLKDVVGDGDGVGVGDRLRVGGVVRAVAAVKAVVAALDALAAAVLERHVLQPAGVQGVAVVAAATAAAIGAIAAAIVTAASGVYSDGQGRGGGGGCRRRRRRRRHLRVEVELATEKVAAVDGRVGRRRQRREGERLRRIAPRARD